MSVKKEKTKKIIKTSFKILSLVSLVFSILVAFYIFNLGKTPLEMNEYKISNGQKTIVFQEMIHIGTTNFYEELKDRTAKYKEEGYTLAYEQVLIESKEEAIKLQELTGITTDIYGEMGKILAVDNQSNHMDFITHEDVNADLKASELIFLLEDYKNKNPSKEDNNVGETFKKLEGLDLGENSKNVVKILLRAVLKVAGDNSEKFIDEGTSMQKIILSSRDQVLFDKVENIENDKILIHYGKFHFIGFLKKLKESNNSWKVIETKSY